MASDKEEDLQQEIQFLEHDLKDLHILKHKTGLLHFVLEQTLSNENFYNLIPYYDKVSFEKVKYEEWKLLQDIMDLKLKKMKKEIMEEVMKELHGPGGISERVGKLNFESHV